MSDAPFVARVSRAKVLRHAVMLAMSAILTGWLTILLTHGMPANLSGLAARLVGGAVVLMLLYCAFLVGRAFFHKDAALVVDADGIYLPGCFEDPLRWTAITRAEQGRTRLNLWLAEGTALPSSKAVKRMVGNNKVIGKPDLPLSMLLTDRSLDELAGAVRSRAPQLFA